jgi:small subunit ribosomal protein S3
MSHTVHPYSHRLGIIRNWKSRWFGSGGNYQEFLKRDVFIRDFIEKRFKGMYVSSVEIERGKEGVKVIINTSRPGLVIGRNGETMTKAKEDLVKALTKNNYLEKDEDLKIDIVEIRSPESDAMTVAHMVGEGLDKRLPFRRVAKGTLEKVMANKDVKGVKIEIAGRLGGADMARREKFKAGSIPLQTFRADVDYALHEITTTYSKIGIKVWIYRGEIHENK